MVIHISSDKCQGCNTCKMVLCPAGGVKKAYVNRTCLNCGACVIACPFQAITLDNSSIKSTNEKSIGSEKRLINAQNGSEETKKDDILVKVNGENINSSGMVIDAIKASGIKITKFFESETDFSNNNNNNNNNNQNGHGGHKKSLLALCECGGCWACMVEVNGQISRSCLTPLEHNMEINTLNDIKMPLRVVSDFGAHGAGGVGTPYPLKKSSQPCEVVAFTHGCNLRCPQCQNNLVAFTGHGNLLEPDETAQILLGLRDIHEVNTITLSGGESTLNRPWLLKTLNFIRSYDRSVNIHVDTNGTILTPQYIDELVAAGMTHIGVDLKGSNLSTFQTITGVEDPNLADKYLHNSWKAVKYLVDNYKMVYASSKTSKMTLNRDDHGENHLKSSQSKNNYKIFIGIGIPYNISFISKKEIEEIGEKIVKIDPKIQVCVLDYRPEFQRRDLVKPTVQDMLEIKSILNNQGLKKVIVQTEKGYLGP